MRKIMLVASVLVLSAALASPLHAKPRKKRERFTTTDPSKLEMVLLERHMKVMVVNDDPIVVGDRLVYSFGDYCELPTGVNVTVLGADRRFVLLSYPAWTNDARATCPRGTQFLLTRKGFRRMITPDKPRRVNEKLIRQAVRDILRKRKRDLY